MSIADNISDLKNKLPNITPTPPGLHSKATAEELKNRLNNGEPALTILDLRDHETYKRRHITGAMNVDQGDLEQFAKTSLEPERDIYLYGASDEETAQVANSLRQAGYSRVAELQGGMAAWIDIYGATEGIESEQPPSDGDFNNKDRMKQFKDEKDQEKAQRQSGR